MFEQIPLWGKIIIGIGVAFVLYHFFRLLGSGRDKSFFMRLEQEANDEFIKDPVAYYKKLGGTKTKKKNGKLCRGRFWKQFRKIRSDRRQQKGN